MNYRSTLALLAFALLLLPSPAHAGDDWHPTVFVNMTPDAKTGKASKACVTAMRKQLIDQGPIKKLGETKTRELVGMPKGGPPISQWPGSVFDRKKWDEKGPYARDKDSLRRVVLVDCRPEEGYFDSLVIWYGFSEDDQDAFRTSIALRGVKWTRKLQDALAKRYH